MTDTAEQTQRSDQITGPMGLGIGIATLAIATPFMAVAVGLLDTTEPVHWALRLFLFLFSGVFVLLGAIFLAAGFYMLVNEAIPTKAPFPLRGARYLLGRITTLRYVVAALPVTYLVAQYYAVEATGVGFFNVGADFLKRAVLLEFIAIHATGFLGVATLLPAKGRLRLARFAILATLGIFYLLAASGEGWEAALFLAYLVAMKIGPFLFCPPDFHTAASLGMRWGFHMVIFLSVVSFAGGLESLRAGTIYWTLIALSELLGMTEAELIPESAAAESPDA